MLFLEKIKQIIFNKKIKTNKQIEIDTSLKSIIEIPLKRNMNSSELLIGEKENNIDLRAFKQLVTNIQFLCVNNISDKKVMLITSPKKETGKSYITANIAVAFSKIGKKVLVIDADMINGKQDKIFNIPNNLGLSNYLSNLDSNGVEINEFLSKFINETAIKNINLITSGTIPPNPAELLASPKLQELIKDAKVFFDIILIDSSEILNKTEALILTRNSNSTIIVVSSGETSVEELENAKKDIQNVGGKILGVVLNKVKLPKEKKTKAQRRKEFAKLKLKIKEKITDTIELIKRKLNNINQKLLEESKEIKIIENNNKEDNLNIKNNNEEENEKNNIKSNEKNHNKDNFKNNIQNNLKNDLGKEKKLKDRAIKQENFEKKTTFSGLLKNIKISDKKDGKSIFDNAQEIDEVLNIENDKKVISKEKCVEIINTEIQATEQIKKENVELQVPTILDNQQNVNSKIEEQDLENERKSIDILKIKNIILDKIGIIKSKFEKNNKEENNEENKNDSINDKKKSISIEKIKENVVNTYSNCKEYCLEKYNYLKNKKLNRKEQNGLEVEIVNNESSKETDISKKTDNNLVLEKKENFDEPIQNEKMLLVIVDAENGYCRMLNREYFSEKPIRGFDKYAGYIKSHYSIKNLKRKRQYFVERYQITEAQAKRIDIVIYDILKDYDEYQWIERKLPSDKAETYALAISKEFEKEPDESEKEYNARCQRLRKIELEEIGLNIEYKLDNLWRTIKISALDKVQLSKFAKIYEIENAMRNDSEIIKSKKTKKFYADIITGAEERLEKANKEDRQKEESEKKVVEEDRKIKQEELKFEQQQFELEKKAAQERIKLEQENIRAEKKAEQERIREEKRKEREIEKIEKKEESIRRKKEKQKQKEDAKFQKEREKVKQREEAKIEEELLVDNLYPKTKHNKNL